MSNMHKMIISSLIVLMISGCSITKDIVPSNIINTPAPKAESYNDALVNLNTPTLVSAYMQRNFRYGYNGAIRPSSSNIDILATSLAQSLFNIKIGLCYDYAAFAYMCLKHNGYNVTVMDIDNPTTGHGICVIYTNGKYNYVDNGGYHTQLFNNLDEIAFSIYSDWSTWKTWDKPYELHRRG